MTRPSLLFLSQTLPYPPDSGGKIRTYHVLRELSRAFDITALCFYRWTPELEEKDVAESVRALGSFGEIEAFEIPQEHERWRWVWDHFRSLLFRRVYTVFAHDSRAFRSRLRALLNSRRFDLVHMDSLDLSGYLTLLDSLPVVCTHHDVQSVLLKRRAKVQPSSFGRAYLRYQARLTKREEREWCPRVALNVTVSESDREILAQIAPDASIVVVPNGVDIDYFRPHDHPDEEGVAFVGGTTWFPNKDALEFFCESILPVLRQRCGSVRVLWIGRSSADERRWARETHGVDLTGYVEDVRPRVQRAACYVVPLRAGGGTRIKILDAWAMGKAVVSTSIGCEGLDARDGENILIRDDPASFAEAVAGVLADAPLRRRLGAGGRETAERLYSWEAIGRAMNERYLALILG